MFYLMIVVFVIGYVCIALEHPLHINKSATALLLGSVMWTLFALGDSLSFPAYTDFQEYLIHHPDATFVSVVWMLGTYGSGSCSVAGFVFNMLSFQILLPEVL